MDLSTIRGLFPVSSLLGEEEQPLSALYQKSTRKPSKRIVLTTEEKSAVKLKRIEERKRKKEAERLRLEEMEKKTTGGSQT